MEINDLNENITFSDKSFTKRILFSSKEQLCFMLNFKPGQSLPVHKHENSSLIFTVLSGTGQVKVNDDVEAITAGSVLTAKGQDDFSIPAVQDDMSALVVISPAPANEAYSKNIG